MSEEELSIKEAVRNNGGYSHNIIGLSLSLAAKKKGDREAQRLIKKYNLDALYGFILKEDNDAKAEK